MRHRVVWMGSLLFCGWMLAGLAMAASAGAGVQDVTPGRWSGGAGTGFVGSTPDGIAEFAINGHADYFVADRVSIGPLAQYSGAGNDFLFGLSVQARYWWDIPGTDRLGKLVLQGGVGFVRAGIKDTDSGAANTYGSYLIPIGIGIDYAVAPQLAVTADFLINFTSLGETVRRDGREYDLHTNIMPALYLGIRF